MMFAVGEAMQAPRFYEYVSRLAPPEQVGTYMGFAFLPIAIGTFVSGLSSGYLVEHFVEGGNPDAPKMWFVVGSYGVVATLLLHRLRPVHRAAKKPSIAGRLEGARALIRRGRLS